MECPVENRGDYTLDRRALFDDLTIDEVLDSATRFMMEHPIDPKTRARLEAYKQSEETNDGRETRDR